MNALILVDIQNDFLPDGALPVPDGDAVVGVANQLMSSFPLVIATQDFHPAGHGSFASSHPDRSIGEVIELNGLTQVLWPDHCVQGTIGAEFAPNLQTEHIDEIVRKGTLHGVDSYSGFFDNGGRNQTALHDMLQSKGVTSVTILGLATDYCVRFTALDAIHLGYETKLVVDGCRGVDLNPQDVENALKEMAQKGVHMVQSANVQGVLE